MRDSTKHDNDVINLCQHYYDTFLREMSVSLQNERIRNVIMNISEINIYPIKSLKGIPLENSLVEKRGLRYDRRWMLTDRAGMFFTQREVPKMAAVTVKVESGGLKVSAEGFGELSIPHEPDSAERQTVTVWDSLVQGLAYRGAVNEWFSDVLSRDCQLVLMPETSE